MPAWGDGENGSRDLLAFWEAVPVWEDGSVGGEGEAEGEGGWEDDEREGGETLVVVREEEGGDGDVEMEG